MTRRNIYLAGFMGTGKSSVGRELARLMGRKFVDTDVALERRLGTSIGETFRLQGEAFFRAEEKRLALELADTFNRVVATGGGTLLDDEVRAAFTQKGLVICLFTSKDELVERLERSHKRPLLAGESTSERVDALLAQRRALYEKISIRVDTTQMTPQQAAGRIHDLLKVRERVLDQLQSQYIELS